MRRDSLNMKALIQLGLFYLQLRKNILIIQSFKKWTGWFYLNQLLLIILFAITLGIYIWKIDAKMKIF